MATSDVICRYEELPSGRYLLSEWSAKRAEAAISGDADTRPEWLSLIVTASKLGSHGSYTPGGQYILWFERTRAYRLRGFIDFREVS